MQTMNLALAASLAPSGDSPTPSQWDAWDEHLRERDARWPSLA